MWRLKMAPQRHIYTPEPVNVTVKWGKKKKASVDMMKLRTLR